MKLDTSLAGTSLKDYTTHITWRRTMNYAAAVGDNNPVYFDDEREGGIVAPPMFAVAVTWPISERLWEYVESERLPKEVLATQVHYTEHLVFHRSVRAGDRLTIKGSLAAVRPHRAGSLVTIRYRAVDERGELVFTEYMGGLLRGVGCCGEAKIAEALPVIPSYEGDGTNIWETPIFVDPLAPFVYDGCTNIFFPIHTSVAFAHKVGLPGIILQGTATLAYAVREIVDREADRNPEALRSVACRFTGMVVPASEIRVCLLDRRSDEDGMDLFFSVIASTSSPVVSDGYARLDRLCTNR